MCGIFLELITGDVHSRICEDARVRARLQSRGPDLQGTIVVTLNSEGLINHSDNCCSLGQTVVLHFIGNILQTQGSSVIQQPLVDEEGVLLFNGDLYNSEKEATENDTDFLRKKLKFGHNVESNLRHEFIMSVFRQLIGPFSIIYFDKQSCKVYFSRDSIGRHSLLVHYSENYTCISSILGRGYSNTWEVPAKYIYSIDLLDMTVMAHDWLSNGETTTFNSIEKLVKSNVNESGTCNMVMNTECKPNATEMLFINKVNAIADVSKETDIFMTKVLNLAEASAITDMLLSLLSKSVDVRVNTQSFLCNLCVKNACDPKLHTTVGILFSGGLDCSILAALTAKVLSEDQPIDLLNVAFENKNGFDVPDRLTARQTLEELRFIFPRRIWNFIEINITREELLKCQNDVIGDLVFPLQSILDESLGSALWFAARGRTEMYTSPCRIILMGSGADELFGGYNRHRVSFKRHSWTGLRNELKMDWDRISYRNLARDSRVIGDHGRQPRFPYLDENFVEHVIQLEPWNRCIPSDSCRRGLGDKLFLRLAAFKLGLRKASALEKRAIQFGSRIANKNENANDISQRLIHPNFTK